MRYSAVKKYPDWLDVALIFLCALLCASVYYALLNRALTGDYSVFFKLNDLPDLLAFSGAATAAVVAWRHVGERAARLLLASGFAIDSIIVFIVITTNRYLAEFPTSGAQVWYLAVAVLGVLAYTLIPLGLATLVKHARLV